MRHCDSTTFTLGTCSCAQEVVEERLQRCRAPRSCDPLVGKRRALEGLSAWPRALFPEEWLSLALAVLSHPLSRAISKLVPSHIDIFERASPQVKGLTMPPWGTATKCSL